MQGITFLSLYYYLLTLAGIKCGGIQIDIEESGVRKLLHDCPHHINILLCILYLVAPNIYTNYCIYQNFDIYCRYTNC